MTTSLSDTAIYPPLALSIRHGEFELRPVSEADALVLARLAARGIAGADVPTFCRRWDLVASPELERATYRYYCQQRANMLPERWTIGFGVWRSGEAVGVQDLSAADFNVTRAVSTGSWVGKASQGHGIGTTMRSMVVRFAFEYLGAITAETEVLIGNVASRRVCEKLGYYDDGLSVRAIDGKRFMGERFRLDRERFEQMVSSYPELTVSGVEAFQQYLAIEV